MNICYRTLFAKITRFTLVALGLVLAVACSKTSGDTVSCGNGEAYAFKSQVYCLYNMALVGSGFTCPSKTGHRHVVGDTIVCSAEATLPADFELATKVDDDASSGIDTDGESADPTAPEGSVRLSVTIENTTKESIFFKALTLPYSLNSSGGERTVIPSSGNGEDPPDVPTVGSGETPLKIPVVHRLFTVCPCSVCGTGKPACILPLGGKFVTELLAGQKITITSSIIEYKLEDPRLPNCPEGLSGSGTEEPAFSGFCDKPHPLKGEFTLHLDYDNLERVHAHCLTKSSEIKWSMPLWSQILKTNGGISLRYGATAKLKLEPNTSASITLTISDFSNEKTNYPRTFPDCPK